MRIVIRSILPGIFLFFFFVHVECVGIHCSIVNENIKIHKLDSALDNMELHKAFAISYQLSDSEMTTGEEYLFVQLLLRLSQSYYSLSKYDSAFLISARGELIIETMENAKLDLKCKLYYQHGLNLYRLNNLKLAKDYFLSSYKSSNSVGIDSIAVLSLKSLGNICFNDRDYLSSLGYYRQSLDVLNSNSNSSKILFSSIYQNIGISFSMLNENDSALYYLTKSIKLKEYYLSQNDPMLASGYINLSRLAQLNGELTKAIEYIDKAEKIFLNEYGGNNPTIAPLYFNKGSILLTLNAYEEALHYHELALELYKIEYGNENEIFPELFLNFGLIYNNLGRNDDAIGYYKMSLIGNVSSEQKVRGNLLLGIAFLLKNDFTHAKKYIIASIEIASINLGEYNYLTANSYLNYGQYFEQIGKLDSSLIYYNKATNIYKNIYGKKSRDLSNTFTLIGSYYLNLGNSVKALEYYQKALIAFIPEFNENNTHVNPDYNHLETDLNLFYTLAGKANAQYSHYLENLNDHSDLVRCLETSNLAIRLFEKIKFTLYGENTKLIVTERVNTVYDLIISASSTLFQLTGDNNYLSSCFEFTEKSKASVLLSTVKEIAAINIGNIPDEIKEKEKLLKRSIAQYQNILFEENQKTEIDSNKVARVRNRLYESKIKYDSLIVSLETDFPEYYNLKYNLDVISIDKIRSSLQKENQAFIEYKLTDTVLYTFIIKKDTAVLLNTRIDSGFSELVNNYVYQISHFPPADSVSFRSYSFAELGENITSIIQMNHPILNGVESIVVIPDDVLGYLSFEALISEKPSKKNSKYNKLNYLIYKYTFSYGYSGTLFFEKSKVRKSKIKVLAIAPVYDQNQDYNLAQAQSDVRNINDVLIPLPYTTDEVEAVAKIFPGINLIGDNATEYNFKQNASEYNILHFAMHTFINDKDPLASKLVFSHKNDTVDDGLLNTYEIYNLDLNAELAVLSACKTGTGAISKGEGIMSLARGFLHAGVPSVIMTLWAIEDMSGANIISGFYQNLDSGQKKADALKNSKIVYLENADQIRAHPYFWAAYLQIGNNDPLSSNLKPYYIYFSGSIVIILTIIVFIIRKRKIKK